MILVELEFNLIIDVLTMETSVLRKYVKMLFLVARYLRIL